MPQKLSWNITSFSCYDKIFIAFDIFKLLKKTKVIKFNSEMRIIHVMFNVQNAL